MAEAAHHCAPFKAVKLNQNKAKNHTTKWWFDTERVQIRKTDTPKPEQIP